MWHCVYRDVVSLSVHGKFLLLFSSVSFAAEI